LQLKVFAGAGQTNIKEIMDDGTVKVSVAAPADKGKANKELIQYLAHTFEVDKRNVTIVKGQKSREKTIKLHRYA